MSVSLLCFLLMSQSPEVPDDLSSLQSLVGIVVENETDSVDSTPDDFPSVLADIISDYAAEAVVSEEVTESVLSYITDVYRDHGYSETGNWAPPSFNRKGHGRRHSVYVPYSGVLPEYEISDFKKPVIGSLTSTYGYRKSFGRFHHGVDLAIHAGDTVKCVLPGVVTKTAYDPGGYGKYVIVSHAEGLETLYGHLQLWFVAPGAKLEAGAPLGLGGSTGNATGPHLHFETRYYGSPTDPSPFF